MNKEQSVSRRVSLKMLGGAGATAALSGVANALGDGATAAAAEDPQKPDTASAVEVALARMGKGHSCAQSVFSAFAEQLGMDYETAVKLTAGFGGGMGLGSICGAVSGGIMALGLKYGGVDPKAKEQTAKLVRQFADRFKTQHKSLNCHDLIGGDLTTLEGRKAAKDNNLFAVCPGLVSDAGKILQELLSEPRSLP
jgi:C_GCAxxG_C_C family probable redox protein